MPFMNQLPKLPVMFVHEVCNWLCWTRNACCHASELKNTHFHFSILVACNVTITLSVVTAVCVTRPLFLYVCCYMGDALLLFVPSRLIQLTVCKDIRTAQTCTYINHFHTTHDVEYHRYPASLGLGCFGFSPLKTQIKRCYFLRLSSYRAVNIFFVIKSHSASTL
jgi:hypothetical protein